MTYTFTNTVSKLLRVAILAQVCCQVCIQAEETDQWPGFLGPNGSAMAEDASIPTEFGPGKNELWHIDTPEGHSSPCIWGDKLFLTGFRDRSLVMLAVDRRDGSALWEKTVQAERQESFDHIAACPAMPTPCSDGERVYFSFGAYGLQAYTLGGDLVWETRLPMPKTMFGIGTSPVLVGDALILVRDGAEDPCILCLNAEDGSIRWKRPRSGFRSNYSTPFVWRNKLRTELIVAGTNNLSSLDPKTGQLIWELTDTCVFPCTSPAADENTLLFAAWTTGNVEGKARMDANFPEGMAFTDQEVKDPKAFLARFDENGDEKVQQTELPASRAKDSFNFIDRNRDGAWSLEEYTPFHSRSAASGRNVMVAIKPGGTGAINETHVVWEKERFKGLPYVPSPLLSHGRVHLVKDGGIVSCLDAATGNVHYMKRNRVSGEYYASPMKVGDKILVTAANGTITVIGDGEAFEILAKNVFDESIFATPAFVNDTLYIRSKKHLWAFAEKRSGDDS